MFLSWQMLGLDGSLVFLVGFFFSRLVDQMFQ